MAAKEAVIAAGYAAEIDWQLTRRSREITEKDFLQEAAWVILSVGLSEGAVRAVFPAVSTAFLNWESARAIDARRDDCCTKALNAFRNRRKIAAIAAIVAHVAREGHDSIIQDLRVDGTLHLTRFAFIGDASSRHLAKSLGMQTCKPDRHLKRIASVFRYESVDALCGGLSGFLKEPIGVIDIVFWRYATLNHNYLQTLIDSYWSTADLDAAEQVVGDRLRLV
jgi:hypothetical protein